MRAVQTHKSDQICDGIWFNDQEADHVHRCDQPADHVDHHRCGHDYHDAEAEATYGLRRICGLGW